MITRFPVVLVLEHDQPMTEEELLTAARYSLPGESIVTEWNGKWAIINAVEGNPTPTLQVGSKVRHHDPEIHVNRGFGTVTAVYTDDFVKSNVIEMATVQFENGEGYEVKQDDLEVV